MVLNENFEVNDLNTLGKLEKRGFDNDKFDLQQDDENCRTVCPRGVQAFALNVKHPIDANERVLLHHAAVISNAAGCVTFR